MESGRIVRSEGDLSLEDQFDGTVRAGWKTPLGTYGLSRRLSKTYRSDEMNKRMEAWTKRNMAKRAERSFPSQPAQSPRSGARS